MAREFRLQDPGEGIHEAEVLDIYVSEGDPVSEGDNLFAVETDKAAVDIPAPFTGSVESIHVKKGQVAEVGQVLLTYRDAGEEPTGDESGKEPAEERPRTGERAETPEGRRTETPENKEAGRPQRAPEGPIPAAPSTRRLARELGVDLRQVTGSGPGGRVTADDVRAAAEQVPKAQPTAEPQKRKEPREPAAPASEAVPGRREQEEQEPLASIRRTTAERTARAWAEIPHVMHQDLADITALERLRRAHKQRVEAEGGKLTLTVLVMKALVAALKHFPRFNASLDEEQRQVVVKHYYHFGVAVDTESGLLVPVVRDVDRKGVTELAVELTALAEKTRQGKAGREELQGGTFTITNPGGIGGTTFTPIINQPEVAILGMMASRLTPVVTGDLDRHRTEVRLLLPLCLAFDHRVNDGADAARFCRHLADILADPERLLLG